MGVGKFLVTLGGIITLLGTYVFAIYGGAAVRGSGIGLILNIPELFVDVETKAASILTPVFLYYIYLFIFIIFLASGLLQILGRKSRLVSFIFSLFPLGVGLMFVFIAYTDVLGIRTQFFALYFAGEALGNFYPFLIEMGYIDLGAYFLIVGGVLGVISVFSERDKYD